MRLFWVRNGAVGEPEIDIWGSAAALVQNYGEDAVLRNGPATCIKAGADPIRDVPKSV